MAPRNPTSPTVPRVLLIGLGGATLDVLGPLAEMGIMPNAARLLQSAALVQLRGRDPHHESAAWATVQTGSGPDVHGRLEESYLDHRRGWILPSHARKLPCPTLGDLVGAADREAPAVQLLDLAAGAAIWWCKPANFEELARGIDRTETAFRRVVHTTGQTDRSTPWRLLQVQFTGLDSLLHRLWHLLGIGEGPGGNRRWIAKTQEAFRTLDACLGELLELAQRRDAAVVVVSPYGFGPFRGKITLSELLRRRDLMCLAQGPARVGYRISRVAWKARRWFEKKGTGLFSPRRRLQPVDILRSKRSSFRFSCQPVRGLLPVDWHRTRAVTLHGQSAALVYLNTPERFGSRTLRTGRQRDQAMGEVMGALDEARHPVTGEPLFDEVYLSEKRFGGDPLERLWPEVVAIPTSGFQTRHRLDRNRHLLRQDASLVATRTGEGLLMVCAPGVRLGRAYTAELADVAPTILRLLGLKPGAAMTGRVVEELFAGHKAATVGRAPAIKP